MAGVSTADSRLFRKRMKLQLRLKPTPKLLVLLLSFFIFMSLPVLASTYKPGAYGSCGYGESCSQPTSSISPIPHKSFFNKYEWIIFAVLISIIILLFFLLLAYRRKNSKHKKRRPALPTPKS